jgi:hypothetical protein
MVKTKRNNRPNGVGYLLLKNGSCEVVEWEINFLPNGVIGNGCIRGDEEHLEAAFEDGCAVLYPEQGSVAAITIDRRKRNKAYFKTLLTSCTPPVFHAKTIVMSGPILDGNTFSIVFSDSANAQLRVNLPIKVISNYIPKLQKLFVPMPTSPTTSFVRIIDAWKTETMESDAFVCVALDNDEAVGLSPASARQLAAELIERAKEVESRSPIMP